MFTENKRLVSKEKTIEDYKDAGYKIINVFGLLTDLGDCYILESSSLTIFDKNVIIDIIRGENNENCYTIVMLDNESVIYE